MSEEIYAITIKQPWAYAVASGKKDVENRPRCPPAKLLGKRVAIHAGKSMDYRAIEFAPMREFLESPEAEKDCHLGAVIAIATVLGWWDSATSTSIGPEDISLKIRRSRWFVGPLGILFSEVTQLQDPMDAKGQLGWWRLQDRTQKINDLASARR